MESGAGKPPMARLLGAGARGAERMAHATGVDRALDQAVEEAIVRALRSPGVRRALERAMAEQAAVSERDRDELARTARRVLESDAAGQVWAELLASDQAQMLVERIATAPEVRAAIAAQSAGLITDIGIRLTKITEALDDAVERVVRRDDESETNQAGLATRLVAIAVDLGMLFGLYAIASSVLASVIPFTSGHRLSLAVAIVLTVLGLTTAGSIIAGFWALAGQTPGMRFLSIRVRRQDGKDITFGLAWRRLVGAAVSAIAFGLGYLAILRNPERHGWHDRLTGTEVVYDVDARMAKHARLRAAPEGRVH